MKSGGYGNAAKGAEIGDGNAMSFSRQGAKTQRKKGKQPGDFLPLRLSAFARDCLISILAQHRESIAHSAHRSSIPSDQMAVRTDSQYAAKSLVRRRTQIMPGIVRIGNHTVASTIATIRA